MHRYDLCVVFEGARRVHRETGNVLRVSPTAADVPDAPLVVEVRGPVTTMAEMLGMYKWVEKRAHERLPSAARLKDGREVAFEVREKRRRSWMTKDELRKRRREAAHNGHC